jgi:hypothetical protein
MEKLKKAIESAKEFLEQENLHIKVEILTTLKSEKDADKIIDNISKFFGDVWDANVLQQGKKHMIEVEGEVDEKKMKKFVSDIKRVDRTADVYLIKGNSKTLYRA